MMYTRNEKLIRAKLVEYLIPGIIIVASMRLGYIVDSLLVGHILGENGLCVLQMGSGVIDFVELPGFVLGSGGSVAVGMLLGKRDRLLSSSIFSFSLLLGLVFGFVFLIMSIFSQQIAFFLSDGDALMNDLSKYIFITLITSPIICISIQLTRYMPVDNHNYLATSFVVLSNSVNLFFDYILLKYTNLGISAAAISTAIGNIMGITIYLFYFFSKSRMLKFVNPIPKIRKICKLLFSSCKSPFSDKATRIISTIVLNIIIIKYYGSKGVAVFAICLLAKEILQLFAGGPVRIIPSLCSIFYGDRDYYAIRKTIKWSTVISYSVLTVIIILLLAFPWSFMCAFGISADGLQQEKITALRYFTLALPFFLANKILIDYYMCIGQNNLGARMNFTENLIFIVPLVYGLTVFSQFIGVHSFMWLVVAAICAEVATFIEINVFRIKHIKNSNILLLPQISFSLYREFSISGKLSDVGKISSVIVDFCNKNNILCQQSALVINAAEEIVTNIINYNSGKLSSIDICIYLENDVITLKIKDNGVLFDPTKSVVNKENTEYIRLLNMNVTVINVDIAV